METRWHDVLVGDLMDKFSKIPFFLIKSKKKEKKKKPLRKLFRKDYRIPYIYIIESKHGKQNTPNTE